MFDKLQQAEQSGMTPEQLKKLEEQAAEQGIRTLWKVSGEFRAAVPFSATQVLSALRSAGNLRSDQEHQSGQVVESSL